MQASQAGRQASLKGSKSVKNKHLFGDKSIIFINKNISVPEGPDVSKSCFQFSESTCLEGVNQNSTVPSAPTGAPAWDFRFCISKSKEGSPCPRPQKSSPEKAGG